MASRRRGRCGAIHSFDGGCGGPPQIPRWTPPAPGARAAVRELEVTDYEPLLDRLAIRFGVREDASAHAHDQPLYRRILGPAWHALPQTLRDMHSIGRAALAQDNASSRGASLTARGRADVTRGRGWLASLSHRSSAFPSRVPMCRSKFTSMSLRPVKPGRAVSQLAPSPASNSPAPAAWTVWSANVLAA